MAVVKGEVYWNPDWLKYLSAVPGYKRSDFMIIAKKPNYKDGFTKQLTRLNTAQTKWQEKNGADKLRPIDITLEYHFRKRTADQNSLLWSLLTVMATVQNAGQKDKTAVTKEQLYRDYMNQYAETREMVIPADLRPFIDFTVLKERKREDGNIQMVVQKTSSYMNTIELAKLVDTIFNDLAYLDIGAAEAIDMKEFFVKWKQHLNDNKIVIRDEFMSVEDYMAVQPICEVSGNLVEEGLMPHHIKTRGAGGSDYASNLIRLDKKHHDEFHDKGAETFAKKYTQVSYKIMTALRRDYDYPEESVDEPEINIKTVDEPVSESKITIPEKPVVEEDDPVMYLYLHTNNNTCIIGCYELSQGDEKLKRICKAEEESTVGSYLRSMVEKDLISEDYVDQVMITAGHEPIYGLGLF